ncbi:MAG: cold shock and DUF1294 domain-containing protein [Burkholderiaceae bacterium]
MRKKGKVLRWDAQRGFGFIRSPDTVAEVFFHVRDYEENRSPFEGMEVSFDEIHVGGKGPRALKVQSVRNDIREAQPLPEDPRAAILPKGKSTRRTPPAHASQSHRQLTWATIALMLTWVVLVIVTISLTRLPAFGTIAGLTVINLSTFFTYLHDKNAAERGAWRISENQLHALSLMGGWPAAWFAQRMFNHKISKAPFQATYWGMVVLHFAAVVALLLWPYLRTQSTV